MNKKLIKTSVVFLTLMMLVMPTALMAQANITDPETDPYVTNLAIPTGQTDLVQIVVNIINVVLGLLGLLAVVIVLIGGFEWMTAGGKDDQVGRAKNRLKYGLIGLAIIFLAYGIVSFVISRLTDLGAGGTGAL